jgi:uncharacterized protein (PEP-CTERM system associated)
MAASAWRSALVIAMLLTTGPDLLAQTRGWTIVPSIGLRGTYTDNVSLAAVPEAGDFVTDIYPGLAVSGRGPRFSANLNYTGNALFYSRNPEQDRLANTLSAFANLEAVEKLFFVDALANVSQSYISPFAPRPTDITTITANRTEARTLSLSPYLRSVTPGGYSYEARYRNTWTSTDSALLAKVNTRELISRIASPISLFGWSIDGNITDINYEDQTGRPERKSSIIRGRLFYQPDSSVRLSLVGGNESNNYVLQQEQSYPIYGYGASWKPTPRTSAEFNWERRFFGPAPFASFEHRTPLTAWRISYSKDVSSYQQELLRLPAGNTTALLDAIFTARIPDPVRRQQAVEQFMRANGTPAFLTSSTAFYSEQVFVHEQLQGSFAILGARNSITFTGFHTISTAVTAPPPGLPAEVFVALNSHINQQGFGAGVSHSITASTSLGANASRVYAETEETGIKSRNDFLALNLAHTVSPKTNTFAGFSYTSFEQEGAPTSYARSVFAGLVHRF